MLRGVRIAFAAGAASLIAACATAPKSPPKPAPAHEAPRHEPKAPQGITLAAVGDTMPGTDYPENILPDDDGVSFFSGVTPVLSAADIAFGNFEGVLLDGGTPVKQCKTKGQCFLFRTPTRYAALLKMAGFKVMSLANNHARDFGEDGRTSSMAAMDAVGILQSGREGVSASWVVKGRRIALVAFAPNVGSNSLNDAEPARALVASLAANHDIVIVSFHGGAEGDGAQKLPFAREIFAGEDRGNVFEFAHAMIDAGADVVLGHGPHVVRPVELYRDRFIAYSLGNFATYYGISVDGIRGIAPILELTLGDDGRFLAGHIEATTQLRPAGPSIDPDRKVIALMRDLTNAAFPDGALTIAEDGTLERRKP
jgi:poly-gamma-glutamate capsule biosynthesis protein CapA/YwtB (metallophosphatase superfamily)